MATEELEGAPWQPVPSGPLVSDPMSALCLRAEYAGNANENFMAGIDSLHRRYDALRRVRGDGNCFFRGFIFALCEQLLTPPPGSSKNAATVRLRARVEDTIRASKGELLAVGYSDVAIDAFWETFVDYLAAMETRSLPELYPLPARWFFDFQTEGGESEYLVWYARLLTAGHLKKHADRFQPFVEGLFPGLTVAQFCAAEVEPMGKECDQPQIAALTEALGIGVKIEYLDGSAKELQTYVCSPQAVRASGDTTTAAGSSSSSSGDRSPSPSSTRTPDSVTTDAHEPPLLLHLLYRPGHYDILYPRQSGSAHSPVSSMSSIHK